MRFPLKFTQSSNQVLLQRFLLVMIGIVAVLFAFLRLWKIESSLLFYGDLSRDFVEFQEWQRTFIPPLLGPQNSALPFNQSPLYFYLLFPFYLASGGALTSTVYATTILHLAILTAGALILRRQTRLLFSWLICWVLIAVHPQFIEQQRYVWNPSFVGVSVLMAAFSYVLLLQTWRLRWQLVWSASLAAAVALSYSSAPTAIAFLLLPLLQFPFKQVLRLWAGFVGFSALFAVPLLVFEVRYNFALTRLMLTYEKLAQFGTEPLYKLHLFFQYLLPSIPLMGFWIAVVVIGAIVFSRLVRERSGTRDPLVVALSLLLLSFSIQLFVPVAVLAHYIFGILALGIVVISLLPVSIAVSLVLLIVPFWMTQSNLESYFQPALRSIPESLSCGAQVCAEITNPAYVTVQAGYHNYHKSPEFVYLFRRFGCEVYDIYQSPVQAQQLLVVADAGEYTHGSTAFDELTQFGNATESAVIECSQNLKVHVLTKD